MIPAAPPPAGPPPWEAGRVRLALAGGPAVGPWASLSWVLPSAHRGVFNLKRTESCPRGRMPPLPAACGLRQGLHVEQMAPTSVGCVALTVSRGATVAIRSSSFKGELGKGLLSGPRDVRPVCVKGYRRPCARDSVASPPDSRTAGRRWSSALKRLLSSRASKGRSSV